MALVHLAGHSDHEGLPTHRCLSAVIHRLCLTATVRASPSAGWSTVRQALDHAGDQPHDGPWVAGRPMADLLDVRLVAEHADDRRTDEEST
jgi:hypothetical protein